MFSEDDLVPLSALQHLVFCERQCALIHLEQQWIENRLTAEGRLLHERVDGGQGESRGDLRITRALPLRSLRLGLIGKADAVEFHRLGADIADGVALAGATGRWRPLPVEYKRGKPKLHRADEVQLCAQALCLEEMLGTEIAEGRLFYGKRRRRLGVVFDGELRRLTEEAAERLHRLLNDGRTPPPVREPKCDACSLIGLCLPDAPRDSARAYLSRRLSLILEPPLAKGGS